MKGCTIIDVAGVRWFYERAPLNKHLVCLDITDMVWHLWDGGRVYVRNFATRKALLDYVKTETLDVSHEE